MKNFTKTSTSRLKNRYFVFLFLVITWLPGFSQNVGINATGVAPNAAAGLDVDFTDKGVLIPRVALVNTASFAPLSAHVAGMLVYNTATAGDVTPGFYYDDGTKWVPGFPAGSALGNMLYWNGTDWVLIPAGTPGQFLQLDPAGIPVWNGSPFATLTTNAATAVTGISATSGGNILADGGSAVLTRGICYSTSPNPTTANTIVTASPATGIGSFSCNLTALAPVTTYYVRAFATNNMVTSYGNEINFTTTAILPILAATTAASAITGTTATSGGNITSDGGAPILERGICYGTTSNPTTANTKIIDGSASVGVFTSNLTGLTGYTTYYVRAYAINSVGTAYGTQISFITLKIPPTLVTVPATNIMPTTATSGGSMNWNGGGYSNYQAYGVAYSTTPNSATPTKVATSSTNGSVNPNVPIAPWTTNITGLTGNTTYYIRSYLDVYSAGWSTVYGNELSFTTYSIETAPISTVTQTTAISGGTIASNISTVTARGVCWSTNPAPTIADFSTNEGAGSGTYVSNVSGLTDNTNYYLRAYFTDVNSVTLYGNELSFKTGIPKVIGDVLAGGKVIYVDITGQHGLIGALVDQGTSVPFGCYGIAVGTMVSQGGGGLYAGLNNTQLIVAACGPGTAAQLCNAYAAGGLNLPGITNWYLPSKDELTILVNQRAIVGLTTSPAAYPASGVLYWSSTEYSTTIGYCHYSLSTYDYNIYKNSTYYQSTANITYVRAVRAF